MRGSSAALSAPEAAGMSRSISMTENATAMGLTMSFILLISAYPMQRRLVVNHCSRLSWLSLNSPSITGTATFSMRV